MRNTDKNQRGQTFGRREKWQQIELHFSRSQLSTRKQFYLLLVGKSDSCPVRNIPHCSALSPADVPT